MTGFNILDNGNTMFFQNTLSTLDSIGRLSYFKNGQEKEIDQDVIQVPMPYSQSMVFGGNTSLEKSNEVLFTQTHLNQVFKFSNDSISVKYTFDFGDYNPDLNKYKIKEEELEGRGMLAKMKARSKLNDVQKENWALFSSVLEETENYLYTIVISFGKFYSIYCNTTTG